MNEGEKIYQIPQAFRGRRLDQALAELIPEVSRSQIQHWIRSGKVLLEGGEARNKTIVRGDEQISVVIDHTQKTQDQPQDIALDLIFEDQELIVVNKPPGLVVHPGAGNPDGTLLNALLNHAPELSAIPRAGIVHRLDKNTSGLLVIARTSTAYLTLNRAMANREIARQYLALVSGMLISGGTVDAPLGRHQNDRKRMSVRSGGRTAITHYRVLHKYRAHTQVRVQLETGRTHQIRVHMAHIKHPIIGDRTYGGRPRFPRQGSTQLRAALETFNRQALHADELKLSHPKTGAEMRWQAPMPKDMQTLCALLQQDLEESDQNSIHKA